jgi:acyl dehydratase
MAARHIENIEALKALTGEHLGWSDWMSITQERVNQFAEATGDHQWIHVDPERAAKGPFGGPIAHGYLTLSLGPVLLPQVFSVGGVAMGVNYGANKVRFIQPVKVGANLRAGIKVLAVDDTAGGARVTLEVTFECEGATKPSCIAEVIFQYFAG